MSDKQLNRVSSKQEYYRIYRETHKDAIAASKQRYRQSAKGKLSRVKEYASREEKRTAIRSNPLEREIVAVDGEGKSTSPFFYHCKNGYIMRSDKPLSRKNQANWPQVPKKLSMPNDKLGKDNPVRYFTQEHIYTVLMASTGDYVENLNGLSTVQCLNFLLSLYKKERLIVGYSFQYDVNMILKDLPEGKLLRLHRFGYVRWRQYKIAWIPRKMLSIGIEGSNKHVTIWDIFGYFQRRFVDALNEWQVSESQAIEQIDAMKQKRGVFASEDDAEIRAYCLSECVECVALMRKLLDCAKSGDIKLTRYDGAGSIASAILKREKVKQCLIVDESTESLGLAAYFGGRFELRKPGIYERLYTYDINSAYPSALVEAPCLTHSRFIEEPFDVEKERGLCLVEWDLAPGYEKWRTTRLIWPDDTLDKWPEIALGFGPFPVRNTHVSELMRRVSGDRRETAAVIKYPARGKGTYWNTEVAAAMRLFPGQIRILKQWRLEQECDEKPFGFIADLFAYRRQLKKKGDLGHLVIKLGINSLYGKTAQSLGSKGRKPPYRNWLIASWTTAHTRAKILTAIEKSNGGIVYIATDGVLSECPIDLPIGSGLGEWEYGEITDVFLARPNLYSYVEDGKEQVKCGGLTKKETSIQVLKDAFPTLGPDASNEVELQRFVGLGAAIMRDTLETAWRKWSTEKRVIRVMQHNRMEITGEKPYKTISTIMYRDNGEESMPFSPKKQWEDAFENSDMQQSLGIEYMDYLGEGASDGSV